PGGCGGLTARAAALLAAKNEMQRLAYCAVWVCRVGRGRVRCSGSFSLLRLELPAAPRQHVLGIAVRLVTAAEHEIERRLESDARVEIRGHRPVGRIALVLPVDDLRHAAHRLVH